MTRMRSPLRPLLLLGAVLAAPLILLAAADPVPTPESVLGFQPGADYKLATYEQSIGYFQKLEAASKFITLVEAGKTTQGRTFYFALISSPKNLAQHRSLPADRPAAGASGGPHRR